MATPVYNFPTFTTDDPPNGPAQGGDLAQAVEDTLQGTLALGDSLDVPNHVDVGGNATIGLALTVGGTVAFTEDRMRPQRVEDQTTISGFSNTSFEAGDPILGLTFVAPPSGIGFITISCFLVCNINDSTAEMSFRLGTGSTIGAGAELLAPSTTRMISTSRAVNSGAEAVIMASFRYMHSGLTPGSTYNLQSLHRVNLSGAVASSGVIDNRSIIWEPVP